MGLFVFKNSEFPHQKQAVTHSCLDLRGTDAQKIQALRCSISLPTALCPPRLIREAPHLKQPPRLGQRLTKGDPNLPLASQNPPKKLRLSWAAREKFTP